MPALIRPSSSTRDCAFDRYRIVVTFVVRRVNPDGFAFGAVGPEVFAEPRRIVCYDGIGCIQDGCRRAVVLLELYDQGSRKILLETVNVLDACATPAINRLVIIADRERHAVTAGKQPQPCVLDRVRILELVYQQMLEATPVMRQQRFVIPQQFMRPQKELGKVDEAATLTDFLV
jgi:hypothetical protein